MGMGDRSLPPNSLIQLHVPVKPRCPWLPLGTQLLNPQLEERLVTRTRFDRRVMQAHASLFRSPTVLLVVTVGASHDRVSPSRLSALSTWNHVLESELVRVQPDAAVLAESLVTDVDVATRARNRLAHALVDVSLAANDTRHAIFELGSMQTTTLQVLCDYIDPAFVDHLRGPLPRHDVDGTTRQIDYQSVFHKCSSLLRRCESLLLFFWIPQNPVLVRGVPDP